MSLTVTLPDGTSLELPDGATGADAAAAIGPGLARAALAVEVSHPETGEKEVRDLSRPLPDGAHISILTSRSGGRALELIRHDAAHVLATAVMELYEGVKVSIGPPIEEGFYYDFEFPEGTVVSEGDFPRIEERMAAHIKAGEAFERRDVPVAEARERFVGERQDYKVELIDDLVAAADGDHPLQTVSLYTNGPFTDLCRGPHAPEHGDRRGLQAELRRRGLLAGRLRQDDADPHLRHRLLHQGGAGRAPGEDRAGQGPRPPQAGARAGPVHVLRAVPRQPILEAGRDDHLERAHGAVAGRKPGPRLPGGQNPDPLRRRAVEAVGPLGQVQGQHVLHRRGEPARWA